ncbi:LytTR family DNA-binding domain-containing protein [Bradyrhizobium sp. JYMT SZCCT0428]|uniref:LytTR family DNA-binding domain-containing protein n=1 Tax=Bradyrhizobium sp. JYMT SZCCT0428 TaxID=2807673 RepID=UPI001BABEB64|nr:LytTR family DNA-binding domain-containing protein [Bradyrhizobium sp. JYMT SZCCT0428]MBR1149143.1 LytTR family transcriptional regulator DNA-binding domain-containing protein [Bradyrhizobium sp. JYMT SZCCT0428]
MTDVKNAPDGRGVEPVWDQNQPAWDETTPRGTSGLFRGITGADWLVYAAVAAVALVIGSVNALSTADDIARRGGSYNLKTPLLWEMTSIAVIILLAPALFAAVRRIRREPRGLVRIALVIAAIIVFSAVHITGMVALRKLVMWLLGGSYDFHLSLAILLYEARKDAVTCLLIGGGMWLIDSRREVAAVATAAPATAAEALPHMVWLRDGTTRIRIEPREIIWISSAGNYVEYSLADGRSHLVRGTLAAAEAQLALYKLARVHRTRLANLDRVTAVALKPSGDFELTFDTGQTAVGSRRYRNAIASLERITASS